MLSYDFQKRFDYLKVDKYKCVFLNTIPMLGLCVSSNLSAVSSNNPVGRSVCKANIEYMQ